MHPEEHKVIEKIFPDSVVCHVYDPLYDLHYTPKSIFVSLFNCIKYNKKTIINALFSYASLKLLRRFYIGYLHSECIKKINPKLVITWIDNSSLFHKCCDNCNSIPFIAIQNGVRGKWCATTAISSKEEKYHIDEYYCFGSYVQDLFVNNEHGIKKFNMCGSVKFGLFYSSYLLNSKLQNKYDICFISQWRVTYHNDKEKLRGIWNTFRESVRELAQLVGEFSNKNNIKVCIALSSNNDLEREFYKKYFINEVFYNERKPDEFSNYKAAMASDLVIALNSTLALEMFGARKKVLFVNPLNEEVTQATSTGLWYLANPSYNVFSERVSTLLNTSNEDYIEKASEEMKYRMNFDPQKLAHKLICSKIKSVIKYSDS